MTDIQDLLQHASDDLAVRPDLLDRVRAGGHRRVVRRRTLLAGGLAVAAAGAAAPFARREGGAPIAAFRPTRGDLAGDQAFLRRVRAVWGKVVKGDGTAGEAHVVWAGATPAGPVALVAQRTHPAGGQIGLTGFVETRDGGLRVASTAPVSAGEPDAPAVLVGRDRALLVVVDDGRAIEFSPDYLIDQQGRIVRRFQPLVFTGDGVALVPVRPQTGNGRIALRETGPGRLVGIANAGEGATSPDNQIPRLLERRLPGYQAAWPAGSALRRSDLARWDVGTMPAYDDPYRNDLWLGPSEWFIAGASPDRRRLVVQTRALDGTARAFWSLGRPGSPRYAGLVTGGVLRVRLPDEQGVVAAALNAALRFRTAGGGWLPVAGDAALLPAAATAVEVTPREGGEPVVVALP